MVCLSRYGSCVESDHLGVHGDEQEEEEPNDGKLLVSVERLVYYASFDHLQMRSVETSDAMHSAKITLVSMVGSGQIVLGV